MEVPTADEVRARSPYLAQRFPDPGAGAENPLFVVLIEDASGLVASLTCRLIGTVGAEEVPAGLLGLARRAVALKAEQLALEGGVTYAERRRAAGRAGIQSFSAGAYSETRFGPDFAAKAKMLDPDRQIHEVLWALATEECKAKWLALWADEDVPDAAPLPYDYGARPGGYGVGRLGGGRRFSRSEYGE